MKTLYLTLIVIALLLLRTNTAQAQTTQPKLNQVELMKQFIGSWKFDLGKDTTGLWKFKLIGTGIESNWHTVFNGKTLRERNGLWAYDKKNDKYVNVFREKEKFILVRYIWFISNSKCIVDNSYSDIANPDTDSIEFKSPNVFTWTMIKNGKPLHTDTFTLIK